MYNLYKSAVVHYHCAVHFPLLVFRYQFFVVLRIFSFITWTLARGVFRTLSEADLGLLQHPR